VFGNLGSQFESVLFFVGLLLGDQVGLFDDVFELSSVFKDFFSGFDALLESFLFFGHGFLLEFFFLLGGSYIVSPDLELFGVEFFVSLGLRGLLESKSHGLHFLGLGLFFFESQLSSGNSVFIV